VTDEDVIFDGEFDPVYVPCVPTGNQQIVRLLEEVSKQSQKWNQLRMAVNECPFEIKYALSFVSACETLSADQINLGLACKIRAVFIDKGCTCPIELSPSTVAAIRLGQFAVLFDARMEVLNKLSLVPAVEYIVLQM
jgi:hypothetical protein